MSQHRVLSHEEVESLGHEFDALRLEVIQDLGESDARYIRRIRTTVRLTELLGRSLLMLGFFPPTVLLGTLALGLSKILENMELGHNVMHGQFDWMNDPEFNGKTFEWNHSCPADFWRKTHNFEHHTYTNIMGKDKDLGYGLLRLFPAQRWKPFFLGQTLYAFLLATFFDIGVAIQDLKLGRVFAGRANKEELDALLPVFWKKLRIAYTRDYVIFPLLAGPHAPAVLVGNFLANLIRNYWTFAIIVCGHFTQTEVFPPSVLANETRGQWYLRQIHGSSNLTGSKLFHVMSGNLSHQIEHHLFPDIPSNRYAGLAVKVRALCEKYGLTYHTGHFGRQLATVFYRIARYAFPNGRVPEARSVPV
jgi:linoleoyl-CoA desaturase